MMIHRAGTFSMSVDADGYVPFSCEITVVKGESVTRDITVL